MKISKAKAKSILYNLFLIRQSDEEIAAVYMDDEIKCPIHLSTGSEGVSVGICEALKRSDYVIGGHRSHGIYLAKGGPLNDFMSEMYGRANGCAGGKGGSMHLISLEHGFIGSTPILGSTIPIGVGNALASKLRGEKRVTAIFFGDGASEEGVFYESLNLAALFDVPVLFVCENNKYSIFQPQDIRQPLDNLYEKGEIFGIPGKKVNGNNPMEVYEAAVEAVDYVRKNGPFLLECTTNRWRQHVGSFYDHEIGFGTKKELDKTMKTQDPIKNFERYAKRNDLLTEKEIKNIKEKVVSEVKDAFTYAQASPLPNPKELHNDLY